MYDKVEEFDHNIARMKAKLKAKLTQNVRNSLESSYGYFSAKDITTKFRTPQTQAMEAMVAAFKPGIDAAAELAATNLVDEVIKRRTEPETEYHMTKPNAAQIFESVATELDAETSFLMTAKLMHIHKPYSATNLDEYNDQYAERAQSIAEEFNAKVTEPASAQAIIEKAISRFITPINREREARMRVENGRRLAAENALGDIW